MSVPLALATLVLAMAGPALIARLGERPSEPLADLRTLLGCQALLVALTGCCLWLALWPLAVVPEDLGLIAPDLSTVLLGGAMAAFFVLLLGPILLKLPGWLGLPGSEATLGKLAQLPVWCLVLAVVIGGIAEEVLYRGVALGILQDLGLAPWAAGALVVLAFAAAHLPMWGPGPALTTAISGTCLTLYYLWHGDLAANIIAHVATDFVGIVRGPLIAVRRGRA